MSQNLLESTLKEAEMTDPELITNVVEFMPYSFKSADETGKNIFQRERRVVHNTPKSFLELIKLFNTMLISKKNSLEQDKDTYEQGLARLIDAEEKVKVLEAELKEKNVVVTKEKEEASKIAERIGKEEAKVQKQNDAAKEKERICDEIKANVSVQQKSAESDVEKLRPMVESALEKVGNLDEKNLKIVTGFNVPPPDVAEVFYCIMCMFAGVDGFDDNIELTKKKLPKEFSWKNVQKMTAKTDKFVQLLKTYPGEINNNNVPAKNFKELKKFSELEGLKSIALMIKKSSAAASVLEFVINMISYFEAMTEMIPKKRALADANSKLNAALSELSEVQALVKELNAELDEKRKELYAAEKLRDDAQEEFDRCMNLLSLAKRLVNALGSEKARW